MTVDRDYATHAATWPTGQPQNEHYHPHQKRTDLVLTGPGRTCTPNTPHTRRQWNNTTGHWGTPHRPQPGKEATT